MIDQNARNRAYEDIKTKTLVNGMKDSILAALKNNSENSNNNEEVLKLVVKREEEKDLLVKVDKITQALAILHKTILKPFPLPRVFQVGGRVKVTGIEEPVKISNFKDLEKYFSVLSSQLDRLARAVSMVSTQPPPKIEIPKFEIPQGSGLDPKVIESLKEISDKLDNLKAPELKFPKTIDVGNFPRQLTPQPVTNININPLRGFVKSTSVTVTTTATSLPASVLDYRRSLVLYNNSVVTVFIGGSDVTSSNGVPVTAASWSPTIDAGPNMDVYAIVATGTADVRVLEASNEDTGG